MAAEWVSGLFALAGSGLTGVLALGSEQSRRKQARLEIESARQQQIGDLRRETYARFLNAATDFIAAWWHLLDVIDRGVVGDDLHDLLRGKVVQCWAQVEQATSVVQIVGPDSVSQQARPTKKLLIELDDVSDRLYTALIRRDEIDSPSRGEREDIRDQRQLCHDALAEFATLTRETLGYVE